MKQTPESRPHIRLTSHTGGIGAMPIQWGAPDATIRRPVVGTTTSRSNRNVIGTHSGSYSIYRALAVASGALDPKRVDLSARLDSHHTPHCDGFHD